MTSGLCLCWCDKQGGTLLGGYELSGWWWWSKWYDVTMCTCTIHQANTAISQGDTWKHRRCSGWVAGMLSTPAGVLHWERCTAQECSC